MSWWSELFGGRGLRPQTTSAEATAELDADVSGWLAAAYDAVNWDAAAEQAALERLRARGVDGIAAVSQAYWSHPGDHALRWALVRCASDLGGDDAYDFLAEVLAAEIAPETSSDIHHFSSVAEESTQRMQAVRGLADAAASGNVTALDALAAALEHPAIVVRHAAYVAVRELPAQMRDSDAVVAGLRRAEDEFREARVAEVVDEALPEEPSAPADQTAPPDPDRPSTQRSSTRRAPSIRHPEGDDRG